MLKCHVNKKKRGHTWVKVNGTPQDLVTELCVVIGEIYRAIKRQHPDAVKEFRTNLIGMLLDPRSPVWKEEDHENKSAD